jgi:hypothetical protein
MKHDLLLIPSASYVGAEMRGEFGPLPPALLPVRGDLLVAEQARHYTAAPKAKILSLLEGFALAPWQARKIAQAGLETVRVPGGLSLGASIIHALNMHGRYVDTLHILHGDTIIADLDMGPGGDAFSAHAPAAVYEWDAPAPGGQDTEVLSGYFCFAEPYRLVREITAARGDFVAGVRAYHAAVGMEARRGGRWYDFGHLQTFYKSRRDFSTERAFNALEFGRHTVRKSSADTGKMAAEVAWFRDMPQHLRVYTPRLLSVDETENQIQGYELGVPAPHPPFGSVRVLRSAAGPVGQHTGGLRRVTFRNCALRSGREWRTQQGYAGTRPWSVLRLCAGHGHGPRGSWTLNGQRTPSLAEIAQAAWATVEAAGQRRAASHTGIFALATFCLTSARKWCGS